MNGFGKHEGNGNKVIAEVGKLRLYKRDGRLYLEHTVSGVTARLSETDDCINVDAYIGTMIPAKLHGVAIIPPQ